MLIVNTNVLPDKLLLVLTPRNCVTAVKSELGPYVLMLRTYKMGIEMGVQCFPRMFLDFFYLNFP